MTLSRPCVLASRFRFAMEAAPTIPLECHINIQWMVKLCINSAENSRQNILKAVQFHLVLEREFLNQHQCCLSGVKKEQVNYSLLDTELVLRDLQILILVSLISLFSLSPPTQSFSSSSCVMILVITPIHGARLRILTSVSCHSWWRQPCPAGESIPQSRGCPELLHDHRHWWAARSVLPSAQQLLLCPGHCWVFCRQHSCLAIGRQKIKVTDLQSWRFYSNLTPRENPSDSDRDLLLWKFFMTPQMVLCVFIPGGMCWFLHKFAQVQQQTNFNMAKNKIILYIWIFADVIFHPGGYTMGYILSDPEKVLAVDCKN